MRTRRALIAAAAAAPLAVAARAEASDREPVLEAVARERRLAALYRAGLREARLSPGHARLVRTLREQAEAHARQLEILAGRLGARAAPPAGPAEPAPPRGHDFLLAAARREGQNVHAYLRAIPYVSDRGTRRRLATVMASGAQHLALLRDAVGLEPLPSAFETGRLDG